MHSSNNIEHDETQGHTAVGRNDSGRISTDSTGKIQGLCVFGDIRSFTEGLSDEHGGNREVSERELREIVSAKLIEIAKNTGKYFSKEQYKEFGDKVSKRSGESIVYKKGDEYIKVKDPFAKQPIKNTTPNDIIFEHIIHNLLFPNTKYTFLGISEEYGDIRIILSQKAIRAFKRPSDKEIIEHLETKLGLKQENTYTWGNDHYAITDVGGNSDNILLGEDGEMYFIDPLIKLKKNALEVIEYLVNEQFAPENK